MKKQGWVGGLAGAAALCAVAVANAFAGPAVPVLSEVSVSGADRGYSTELLRLAAAEGAAPFIVEESLGGGGDRSGAPEGGAGAKIPRETATDARNTPSTGDLPTAGSPRAVMAASGVGGEGPGAGGPSVATAAIIDEPLEGTGESAKSSSADPFAADESVLLNFERGDIREVIHSLATALGLSYMIDPRVEGQVTIRTIGRIPKDHLFPVFNRILRNNGIAAIKVGEVYHIVPVGEAKTRAILPPSAATRAQLENTDSFIIEIIPVSHVPAEDMVGVLEPFVTPGGDVFAYPRGNLLIVTDLLSNVERLRDLASTLDTDAFRGMKTRVYKIKHGDLEIISEELATLLASYGHSVDGSTGLSLIPMPRLESLTCISYDAAVFDQIARWLDVLDIKPEEGAGRKIYVYRVENTKAGDLASILNELFGDGGSGRGSRARRGGIAQSRGAFGRPGATGRRGGLSGSFAEPLTRSRRGGTTAARQTSGNLRTMTAEQRSPGQTGARRRAGRTGRQTGARARRGAQPGGRRGQAAGSVGVVLPGGRAAGGSFGGIPGPPPIFKEEVRIVADEVTNSLVFLAVKQDYEKVLEVLREIDVVPRQVVIEVVIAEVTLDKSLEFGVDHSVRFAKLLGEKGSLNDSVSSVRPSGAGSAGEDASLADAIFALANPGAGGLAAYVTDKQNFAIVLKALASRSLVKIISAPHIIAADNREAHIQVGESIPVLTSSSQSTLTTSNVINQVQYRDVGTILTILPQVNSAGLVNMQITQEVSKVSERTIEGINSPAFLTREAETTVVVQDGDSILIGGIIDEQQDTERSGVPFIMDIPVLGRFFRLEKAKIRRTELLVLITPYVIRGREEALAVTDDFKRTIRGIDRLIEHRRGRRVPRDENAQMEGQGRL